VEADRSPAGDHARRRDCCRVSSTRLASGRSPSRRSTRSSSKVSRLSSCTRKRQHHCSAATAGSIKSLPPSEHHSGSLWECPWISRNARSRAVSRVAVVAGGSLLRRRRWCADGALEQRLHCPYNNRCLLYTSERWREGRKRTQHRSDPHRPRPPPLLPRNHPLHAQPNNLTSHPVAERGNRDRRGSRALERAPLPLVRRRL
jgi:hypothetical protein